MSKWVNVRVIQSSDVMVEIEDDSSKDDAIEVAVSMFSNFHEVDADFVEPKSVETYKRHADEISSL